jgi:hypothetical protein
MTLRRDFLAFTAGAVVAKTVLPLAAKAAPVPEPDLHAACARFWEAHDVLERWNRHEISLTDETATPLTAQWHDAMVEISNHQTRTVEGIRAKAKVMLAGFDFNIPTGLTETVEGSAETHEWLAWRLAQDLLETLA